MTATATTRSQRRAGARLADPDDRLARVEALLAEATSRNVQLTSALAEERAVNNRLRDRLANVVAKIESLEREAAA